MKLKGSTKIVLTDVKTGKKDTYTHDNTITEFAEEYFRELGYVNSNPLGSLSTTYPLDSLFGGIMCFDSAISGTDETGEHALPLYPPSGVSMIANGSIAMTSNSDATELGQYNSAESSSSATQRVYVYDWDTSEGNGTIMTVCLTSERGGYIGCGNTTSEVADSETLNYSFFGYTGRQNTIELDAAKFFSFSVSGNYIDYADEDVVTAMKNGSITVTRRYFPFEKLNPFTPSSAIPSTYTSSTTYTFTARSSIAYAFIARRYGYTLLVGTASTSPTTLYVVKIASDGTVTELTYNLSNAITFSSIWNTDSVASAVLQSDNTLYIAYLSQSYSGAQYYYKVDSDGTVTVILSGTSTASYAQQSLVELEGSVYGCGHRNELPINTIRSENATFCNGSGQAIDNPYVACGTTSDYNQSSSMFSFRFYRLPCNWLSTINVLSDSGVTKTSDKTMKITYTLTLES